MASNMIPRKRRKACERCHSQKLRCPPPESVHNDCGRCVKAGVTCVFGNKSDTFQQSAGISSNVGIPDGSIPRSTNNVVSDMHSRFATPGFDPEDLLFRNQPSGIIDVSNFRFQDEPLLNEPMYNLEQSTTYQFPFPVNSDGKLNDSDPSLNNRNVMFEEDAEFSDPMRLEIYPNGDLTMGDLDTEERPTTQDLNFTVPQWTSLEDLNSSLNAMHASIPSLTIHNKKAASISNNGEYDAIHGSGLSENDTAIDSSPYTRIGCKPYVSMDKVLQLTEGVTRALEGASTAHKHNQSERNNLESAIRQQPTCANGSSTQILTSSFANDGDQQGLASAQSMGIIDRASIFLLLACFHRCMDIWKSFLGHIEQMIDRGIFPTDENGGVSPCKPVMVGSYTPSSTPLSVSLLLMTIRDLLSQLHRSCKALVSENVTPPMQPSTNGFCLTASPNDLHQPGTRKQTDHDRSCLSALESPEIQLAFKNATLRAEYTQDHLHTIVKQLGEAGKIPTVL